MAAFRATERGQLAAEYGKEEADAAVGRLKHRLEKLKAMQVWCLSSAAPPTYNNNNVYDIIP